MRALVIILFSFLFVYTASAQRDDVDEYTAQTFKDRGFLGLGFGGLGFGTDLYGRYFSVGVSGLAGYMFTPRVSAGLGLQYQYTNYSDLHYKNNMYVGYPFVRYNIKSFFFQADYDLYSLNVNLNADRARKSYDRLFVGLGYAPMTGGRSKMNFLVSYDLFYPNSYIFPTPFNVRLFFTF